MPKANYVTPGIPLSFQYKGKNYNAILSKVPGAGGLNIWHLTVNNFYWGALSYTDKWVFHNPKNEMKELADFFGSHVNAKVD